MAAPNIQIAINDETVRLMWNRDTSAFYVSYNLYWSSSSSMAGEAKIASAIPNVPDAYYGKETILYTFKRATLLLAADAEFYVRLKGINSLGVEDNIFPGLTRLIPSIYSQREEYNSAQMYGWDPIKGFWKKIKVQDSGALASS